MVFAVYMPPQAPGPGQAFSTIVCRSSCEIEFWNQQKREVKTRRALFYILLEYTYSYIVEKKKLTNTSAVSFTD